MRERLRGRRVTANSDVLACNGRTVAGTGERLVTSGDLRFDMPTWLLLFPTMFEGPFCSPSIPVPAPLPADPRRILKATAFFALGIVFVRSGMSSALVPVF
jgi:hypothetical protein